MTEALLHQDLSGRINELRHALGEMLTDVGADISKPRDMSRQLALDKNLAWKISRVVSATDAQDAIQYVPGDAALDILIRAVKHAGGATEVRRRAEGAIRNFQAAVIRHMGDRPTLDLVVDGLPDENGARTAVARKLLFRGASVVHGVQAKAMLQTSILAPSDVQEGMLDIVRTYGWIDFRRIRKDARWVLFHRKVFDRNAGPPFEESVDPGASLDGPKFIADFCSASLPEIHTTLEDNSYVDELGKSPIGNSGAFTCFGGSIRRVVGSRYVTEKDTGANLSSNIAAPAEALQIDHIMHRDLAFINDLRFRVYNLIATGPSQVKERNILPIEAEKSKILGLDAFTKSPHYPRYGELLERVFNRTKWNMKDFVCVRFTLQYPPFPSTAIISFPLEQRPAAG